MWFDIIKDSKQVSRTVGGIDWEKETIPEKEEPKCKEKLMAIQDALIDWEPPNSKYKGGSHRRGSNVSTSYYYQNKNNLKPAEVILGFSDQDWLENKNEDYCRMIIQYDSHWIKDLSEEEACAFLEKLKKFNFNSNELLSDTPVSLIAVSTSADFPLKGTFYLTDRPHSIIQYKGKEDDKIFYHLLVGNNDKDYAQSTIRELQAFIKQQL